MKDLLEKFKSADNEVQFSQALNDFIKNYMSVSRFEYLDQGNHRSQLWQIIYSHLEDQEDYGVCKNCLIALRILSRDKTGLDDVLSKERLTVILKHSGYRSNQDAKTSDSATIEAQKLLCNLLFNSAKARKIVSETPYFEFVLSRIDNYNSDTPYDTKLFDMRALFLITALNVDSWQKIGKELPGDVCLMKFLYLTYMSYESSKGSVKDNEAVLICEILKTLFNLLLTTKEPSDKDMEYYEKLLDVLKALLLQSNESHKRNFESNVINLLTVIPRNCYCQLIAPEAEAAAASSPAEDDRPADMRVVDVLIEALNERLSCCSSSSSSTNNEIESLSPVLTAFAIMCRVEKPIRKYVRMKILPPLKDVTTRPEEGSTMRNKLCKFLTSPITEVKDLAAEFLFILCKEKVGRMIKYTGYGNAAGMFANKGLLSDEKINYSSDSESSDTEEYQKIKNQVNPVTGCYENPKPNPLENMTEEQKEYEAIKLVGLVDKLQRSGVIQPCRIEDGKPKPIEHVLELEEHLPKLQIHRRNSDSD